VEPALGSLLGIPWRSADHLYSLIDVFTQPFARFHDHLIGHCRVSPTAAAYCGSLSSLGRRKAIRWAKTVANPRHSGRGPSHWGSLKGCTPFLSEALPRKEPSLAASGCGTPPSIPEFFRNPSAPESAHASDGGRLGFALRGVLTSSSRVGCWTSVWPVVLSGSIFGWGWYGELETSAGER
jgi:hypothetical protein